MHSLCLLIPTLLLTTLTTVISAAPLKQFTLNLTSTTLSPDGYPYPYLLANGQLDYPIEVNKGDDVEITVHNNLDVETSLHWHGIFQRNINWQDGPGMVTQCPILPGETFVYRFSVKEQAGTYWWHAHYKAQYINGLRGPLIIHDPESVYLNSYDEDITLTLTDVYHNTSDYLLSYYFEPGEGAFEPVPETILIGGQGRYDCSFAKEGTGCVKDAPRKVIEVEKGKKYRLRLINTSSMANFNFTIDGHSFTVIESDGVETQPQTVKSLNIATSQRYSIILTADSTLESNFWIRAEVDTTMWAGAPTDLNGFDPIGKAILRYKTSPNPNKDPTSTPTFLPGLDEYTLGELVNTAPPDVELTDINLFMRYTLLPDPETNVTLATVSVNNDIGDVFISDTQYKMPRSYPTLFTTFQQVMHPNISSVASPYDPISNTGLAGKLQFDPSMNMVPIQNGSWVSLTIINDDITPHVFHLHGHTFHVVGHGTLLNRRPNPPKTFGDGGEEAEEPQVPVHYPRKDAIQVPPCKSTGATSGETGCLKGYARILFQATNPGVHLLHCHMEWHMQAGLSFTFVNAEGLSDLYENMPANMKADVQRGKCRGVENIKMSGIRKRRRGM
ncbi:hypothetical protein HDV05_004991 [Chytridiales sp. JEL 0842]|nr:hypothetical protein HDV05_004991 [Chytridiales sp. JEL 0842]